MCPTYPPISPCRKSRRSWKPGGAEQTTIDVAHAVVAQGGKALVATKGGGWPRAWRPTAAAWPRCRPSPRTRWSCWATPRAADRPDRSARRSAWSMPDRAPAFSALWAAHATKTPFVATYHGVYNAKSKLKRWYNAIMTKGCLVIANSEYTRQHVIQEHGIAPDKVVAIPRGVDLSRFEPASSAPSGSSGCARPGASRKASVG
ncbi:glycosyltransferase [Caulobacter segnis]